MAYLLKKQLLKRLSRFTKNLEADQINFSTLGEGMLTNLELDELVLTDLLELPSWLCLTSARCNAVSFHVQWASLKSTPITLCLDEVHIEVETCRDLRSQSVQSGLSSMAGGQYGFISKVIDGITVCVNTVHVTFQSPAFVATVEMSRITVESKSPQWTKVELSKTRLKDAEKGQVLIFKEVAWQTVRIEAKSTQDRKLAPLRLLTNQARCRIVIKKRISDGIVMGSRLLLILNHLLWVLTDSQLKAAFHFLNSLSGLVQKATEVTRKRKAARKLELLPEYQAQISQQARKQISKPSVFSSFDVIETSYHFLSQSIEIHLCDDPGVGRSSHPDLHDDGALQVTLDHFQVDYYPYHLSIADRKHWHTYNENASPHTDWLRQSFTSFRDGFLDLIDSARPQHVPLSRSSVPDAMNDALRTSGTANGASLSSQGNQQDPLKRPAISPQGSPGNPLKHAILTQLAHLMTSCIILRIKDFTLYRVTTHKRKQAPKAFITGDERTPLPDGNFTVHAEFTYYYYPGDTTFPLPSPKFYVQLNPIQVYFDVLTILWANSFVLGLYRSLQQVNQEAPVNAVYVDVKLQANALRVIFEATGDQLNQKDRPRSLHLQSTRVFITNVRSSHDSCSRADLAKCVNSYQLGSLFFGSDFPSKPGEYHVVIQKFIDHLEGIDCVRLPPPKFHGSNTTDIFSKLTREHFWVEARDVWFLHFEPVWADFYGVRAVGCNRPTPFIDTFPVTLWVYMKPPEELAANVPPDSTTADIHVLAHVSNLVSVQLNHYQLLFLLRLAQEAEELVTLLTLDQNRILGSNNSSSKVVGALLPQVEVTLVMPSSTPGKESSGGDVESVFPDSSSLGDELIGSGNVDRASVHFSNSTGQFTQDIMSKRGFSQVTANGNSADISMGQTGTVSEMSATYTEEFQIQKVPRQAEEKQPASNTSLNNFNYLLNSSRKAFNKMTNSIDFGFKPHGEDTSDLVSLPSDGSSDSESFVMPMFDELDRTYDAGVAMFTCTFSEGGVPQQIEIANEVLEEEPTGTIVTTPSERADSIDSSIKRRDLISMVTFKLFKVEFLQQSEDFSSVIKVQIANVLSDECGAIPWDEFQSKFSSRPRAWEMPPDSAAHPRVQLRLDHCLKPHMKQAVAEQVKVLDRSALRTWFNDLLEVHATDLPVKLTMSTVTGLTDLIEDEVILPPLPMEIFLENISVHLTEDRLSNNITSPGSVPIELAVSCLHITRNESGVFNVAPPGSGNAEDSEKIDRLERSLRRLTVENEELRRRLVSFEQLTEENHRLRKSVEESDALRTCLASVQDNMSRLLDEKTQLLNKIQTLQKLHRSGSSGSTSTSGQR